MNDSTHTQQISQARLMAAASCSRRCASFSFRDLPREIGLKITQLVSDDCLHTAAALCVAFPPLGLEAIRTISACQTPLFSVAMGIWCGRAPQGGRRRRVVTEALLRKYASESCASASGCAFLKEASMREQAPESASPIHIAVIYLRHGRVDWRLSSDQGGKRGALLRSCDRWGVVTRYAGPAGSEQRVLSRPFQSHTGALPT